MLIYEDNHSAICLDKNPKNLPKTKNINIKYHFIRKLVGNNQVEFQYCPTSNMLADIFAKGLPLEKLNRLRSMLGVIAF